jgi:predicted nucleotidyltransferase
MVNNSKPRFTLLQQEILKLLARKAGEPLNLRKIASLLTVSPTAVSKSLSLLEKSGLVTIKRYNNSFMIELNIFNNKAIELKRVENLRSLYESSLLEFLKEKFPAATIILFGSFSFGEDTVKSDIDIAIIGAKEKEIDLQKYEKILERKIFLHFYKNLKEINKNLRENILNGITLKGGIEL